MKRPLPNTYWVQEGRLLVSDRQPQVDPVGDGHVEQRDVVPRAELVVAHARVGELTIELTRPNAEHPARGDGVAAEAVDAARAR